MQTNNKILIAYFSHSGNTYTIAQKIQALTGGDLFEIIAVNPYPQNYDACIEQAKREQQANVRPKLAISPTHPATYEMIFIGYPNWWGTMPMPVFTFLETDNFSGKTIAPFCTHEGSGMGHSEYDIAKYCPQAIVQKGLAIRGSNVDTAKESVRSWLTALEMNSDIVVQNR